jgi:hypothetical protein
MRTNNNQTGSARLKLIIFLVVFGVIIYIGYVFLPVAIDSYYFKDVMQNKVDMTVAQGKDADWLKDQLIQAGPQYHVPPDAVITPKQNGNAFEVTVKFTRPLVFPGYTYKYEFDYTARSTQFLSGGR